MKTNKMVAPQSAQMAFPTLLGMAVGVVAAFSFLIWGVTALFFWQETTAEPFIENTALIQAVRESSADVHKYLENPNANELLDVRLCEDAIARNPRDWTAYRLLAGTYFELAFLVEQNHPQRQFFMDEGTANHAITVLRTPSHPYVHVNGAKLAELRRDYQLAVQLLEQAVPLMPRENEADRRNYGRVLGDLGRLTMNTGINDAFSHAIPRLNEAITILKDDAGNARLNRATCFFLTDRHEQAFADYHWILDNFADYALLCAEACAGIAEVYENQGDIDQAAHWVKEALTHDPDNRFAKQIQGKLNGDTM